MARPAPEVPLRGATARRAPCQRRVRAVVPPSHRFDWTGPGVCGRGGARAGDAAKMVSSNREAKPPPPHPTPPVQVSAPGGRGLGQSQDYKAVLKCR